jgi:hypothetical protein
VNIINNTIWSTWTSLALLAPAITYFSSGEYLIAGLIVLAALISTVYHLNKPLGVDWIWHDNKTRMQRILLWLDMIVSTSVGLFVVAALLTSSFDRFDLIVGGLGLFALFFLVLGDHYYEALHGFWHLFAALVLILTAFV